MPFASRVVVIKIRQDTAAIQVDTSEIKPDTVAILDEIEQLQARLPQPKAQDRDDYMLQRYLIKKMTTYIEGMLKGLTPLVSNIVVHGNERNFCSALVCLEPDAATAWAAQHGLAGKSYAEIAASPQIQEEMQRVFDELNSKLNRWETIKKFRVLDRDLSIESGELTPSLKVKRKVVEENFRDVLDGFYS